MKKHLVVFLIFFLAQTSVYSTAQEIITKAYCRPSVGHMTIEDLKRDLLSNAKRVAVNEFFGEFITSFTKIDNFSLTEDKIRASSAGFIRIKGNPVYKNGSDFSETCVTIDAYVTKEDKEKLRPIKISKKYCDSDSNLTTRQLKNHVKEQAIIVALTEYDRKLEGQNKDRLLPLVHQVKNIESGFIPDTETYCSEFEGTIYPIEILSLAPDSNKPKEEPTKLIGKWETSSGKMTLKLSGKRVTGNYGGGKGEILGTLDGNILDGYWVEDSATERCSTPVNGRYYWGRIKMVFTKDKFTSSWGYCDGALSKSDWTGHR